MGHLEQADKSQIMLSQDRHVQIFVTSQSATQKRYGDIHTFLVS